MSWIVAAGYVIVGTCVRVSTFINLVICVVRAVNIVLPFYRVKRRYVVWSIVGYATFWSLFAFYDVMWFQNHVGFRSEAYTMRSLVLKPEVGFAAVRGLMLSVGGDIILLFVLPFLVPVVLLAGSTLLQVCYPNYTVMTI